MKDKISFPKCIYQVWFQGQNDPSFQSRPELRQNQQGWKYWNHSTWSYRLLDQHDLQKACRFHSSMAETCFQRFVEIHIMLAIDFGRYCYLYQHGGIYVDFDMWCLRSLDHSAPMIQFLEKRKQYLHVLGVSEMAVQPLCMGGKRLLNSGMMISTSKHPFLYHLIRVISERGLNRNNNNPFFSSSNSFSMMERYIYDTTGPMRLTTEVNFFLHKKEWGSSCSILQFPHTFFEPCFSDLQSLCKITKDTVAIHQHELSWVKKGWKTRLLHRYNSLYVIGSYLDVNALLYFFLCVVIVWYLYLFLRKNKRRTNCTT